MSPQNKSQPKILPCQAPISKDNPEIIMGAKPNPVPARFPLFLLILLVFGTAGCALTSQQKSGVEAYARSTSQLGQLTADEFRRGNASVKEINKLRGLLEDKSVPPTGTI